MEGAVRVIAIGTCSKFPVPLNGRRVRVLPCERRHEWPRAGDGGHIYGVSGPFVLPHDGVEWCAHVDHESNFTIRFDDGQQWTGFPPRALKLISRFKVWTIDPDGEPSTLLLRTGSDESGTYDTVFESDDPVAVAKFACARRSHVGRVLVKNFDTGLWYTVDGDTVTEGRT